MAKLAERRAHPICFARMEISDRSGRVVCTEKAHPMKPRASGLPAEDRPPIGLMGAQTEIVTPTFRRRSAEPTIATPKTSIAQVAGSGTQISKLIGVPFWG